MEIHAIWMTYRHWNSIAIEKQQEHGEQHLSRKLFTIALQNICLVMSIL